MKTSIIKPSIAAILAMVAITSHAFGPSSAISFDFDGDGITDQISYFDRSGSLVVNYQSSLLKKNKQYTQNKFDECSSMGLYQIPGTSQISIDGSCPSQGGQIYIHIYEWKKKYSDWCLIREITGEKPDFHVHNFIGSRHVSTVSGCPRIGDDGPYDYAPESAVTKQINQAFEKLAAASNNPVEIKRYIRTVPFYEPLEISEHLTRENVENANNLAFYLSENGRAYDALQLLQAIVHEFPERVVAKLNLADAFWASDMIEPAKEMYVSYVTQMKKLGKAKLIPRWAAERYNASSSPTRPSH